VSADVEFNLITAVIPVLHPGKFVEGLLAVLRETNRLGIQTIFIIDEFVKNNHEDQLAVAAIRAHDLGLSKVISGSFGNPGAARNAALAHISTKWITFWDADDALFPAKYQQSVVQFPNADLIVGGYEERNLHSTKYVSTTDLRELAFSPGIWRLIFKAELLRSIEFKELSMGEDQLFLMELALDRKSVVYVNDIFYTYHTSVEGQLTRSRQALKDLSTTAEIASAFARNSAPQSYLRVIALRLYLAMSRQSSVPLRMKLRLSSIFARPKFAPAFLYILKRRMNNIA
jgi:hypothetical protein